ncbi:hypothetical protein OPQ81_011749 [Rhizoctonia solani]|nr:hypothetical protein OPQ81_011749 [Rhizoctonia solani]
MLIHNHHWSPSNTYCSCNLGPFDDTSHNCDWTSEAFVLRLRTGGEFERRTALRPPSPPPHVGTPGRTILPIVLVLHTRCEDYLTNELPSRAYLASATCNLRHEFRASELDSQVMDVGAFMCFSLEHTSACTRSVPNLMVDASPPHGS